MLKKIVIKNRKRPGTDPSRREWKCRYERRGSVVTRSVTSTSHVSEVDL